MHACVDNICIPTYIFSSYELQACMFRCSHRHRFLYICKFGRWWFESIYISSAFMNCAAKHRLPWGPHTGILTCYSPNIYIRLAMDYCQIFQGWRVQPEYSLLYVFCEGDHQNIKFSELMTSTCANPWRRRPNPLKGKDGLKDSTTPESRVAPWDWFFYYIHTVLYWHISHQIDTCRNIQYLQNDPLCPLHISYISIQTLVFRAYLSWFSGEIIRLSYHYINGRWQTHPFAWDI